MAKKIPMSFMEGPYCGLVDARISAFDKDLPVKGQFIAKPTTFI